MEIQLQNLTKKFPNRNRKHPGDVIAVNEFNFTIPDGQLIGLLGPSGCGKSTTLNLICGLEKPTSGKIFFGGEDVTGVEPEHRSVGMVFQNYALYPHLTVRKNIMFPLENLKGKDRLSKEEMEKRVLDAAKMVSLEELLDRKPRELSGGQQQRVAIARALVKMPRVLYWMSRCRTWMRACACRPGKKSAGFSARRKSRRSSSRTIRRRHEYFRSIVVMKEGILQQIGKPQEVYDQPANLLWPKFWARRRSMSFPEK